MLNIKETSILDLIPPNLKNDLQIQAAALALDGELQEVNQAINQCLFISRINELPEAVLDLMAWQLHIDFYEPDLPMETKQLMVRNSDRWHMRKGTPAAVEELITAVFDEGRVQEWYEYGGDPYKFKVITFNAAVSHDRATAFIEALNSIKNARSILEAVEITMSEDMPLFLAGVVYTGDYLTIEQVV